MRTRAFLVIAALLVAARPGLAQAPQPAQAPAAATPLSGTFDIGAMGTAVDGDEARYERYRDDRSGVYTNFRLNRESGTYLFNADAFHIGYRDQRYNALLMSRRLNVNFNFVGTPLNYMYGALTPYSRGDNEGEATLALPDAAQAAVQGPSNATTDGVVGVPCAPGGPPAACSNPAQAALAKANRSIYNDFADAFDMRHTRNTAAVGVNYRPTLALDVDARFTTSARSGEQPWGASFAFNDAIELPLPLNQRTNDFTLGTTWANARSMVRVAWDGSWFNNNITSLAWDNPIRITDFTNGLLPPSGPYDPSGYSNGNGPAFGRMSVAPDNMMHVIGATAMYKLPARSTVNGVLQLTTQTQDEELIPWTSNALINNTPQVIAAFPALAALPRPTAEAEARGTNAMVNFTSRAWRPASVNVRYRFNERDVETPPFDATEYVRFDAVPEEIEEGISHQYDVSRHIFDANVSFTPIPWGTLRVGYGHETVERHGRGFADVGENIFRLSFDTYRSQYFTVRGSFDYGVRRGEGFVETHPVSESEDLLLILGPAGTQPTLRYYDEADRDRTRASVQLTVFPRDTFDVYFQLSGGRDRYQPDDELEVDASREGELFGLQEQDVFSWNVGANFHPTEVVTFGANYGRDRFSSFQLSRNANPPPDPSWIDPNRNWTLDNDDEVNTISLFLDVLRAVRNTDIRVGYDYSDSANSFVHGGPRIAALQTLGQFIPLPDVENTWHRANADVQYFFTNRVGVGVGWYFEKLDITDWNTIDSEGPVGFATQTEEPRIDWLGGLITGYGNRPYTGNTTYVRLLYRF